MFKHNVNFQASKCTPRDPKMTTKLAKSGSAEGGTGTRRRVSWGRCVDMRVSLYLCIYTIYLFTAH